MFPEKEESAETLNRDTLLGCQERWPGLFSEGTGSRDSSREDSGRACHCWRLGCPTCIWQLGEQLCVRH